MTKPNSSLIDCALDAIRTGKLVAIPTETVYGLGADASNRDAIQKIYQLKRRPTDHPLIVHVQAPPSGSKDLEQEWLTILSPWTRHIPESALILIKHFWPGPLTLVFEKSKSVLDSVTGGQATVAIRSPAHPLTQELLQRFGGGIAAPSANRYGRISPTSAADVEAEFPNNPDLLILDGGPCEHGIESTILDVSGEGPPKLLRPGSISPSMIKASTGIDVVSRGNAVNQPRVSGTHLAHYAPHTALYLYSASDLASQLDSLIHELPKAKFALLFWEQEHSPYETELKAYLNNLTFIAIAMDPALLAKQLYRLLRDLDQGQYQGILIPSPPKTEAWDAVRDRLQRASFGSGPSSNNHVSN
ncbi:MULTISPECIES: L-threonylcarbamoyladenylate synthase [unclassified Polynucleobacter]|uniref:L-threonylcarbamoyladenylate synthase n=1 Tax=unclassified Polynucleobacter TaxID=2640945 RepID=UPI00257337A6|nr:MULTISPECIES: L-threonylcarbamoyladenylate synthase [unclassified Polynucleobacter]BEI43345.1 L-threonylcarbamoyladenylate synthase [Polynucleobacter sp. HIN10]BEI45121.1 L-threonylcarbamoyladenylate synthase [Polynucleobacter sp. HIN11]